jgi:flavin-dependent dehydrogenase
MKADFDLAVIGAGPAGAAAALTAARLGLTVALFEPARALDKPCGEGILPSGVRALRELGLGELVARGQPLERIGYVLASGRELEVAFDTPGCALERPVLACALDQALAAEPRLARFESRATCARAEDGFRITGAGVSGSAATLVAADGLNGDAAEWLRRRRGGDGRFGLRARAEARDELGRVEVHLGRASEVYLTPLPARRINVAVLCDRPAGERSSAGWLAAALAEHPRAARVLGAWVSAPEARALQRARPRAVAERGAFLAGDAAGGVDPVLGCGVAIALATGIAAARAAVRVRAEGSGAPERDYARTLAHETRTRRAVAHGLTVLAAHPGLQELARGLFALWPSGVRRLARRVAGA